jgi:hypothetical protein
MMLDSALSKARNSLHWRPICDPGRMRGPLRADLSHQVSARHVNVCQSQRYKRPRGVLCQATVARLVEPPKPLDNTEDVLHPCANPGLVSVLGALDLVNDATPAHPLIGEVLGLWRLGLDQLLLAGVGAVAIHPLLLAMQQVRQRVLVVYVGSRHHRVVG